jgi:hypothetical protein
LLTPQLLLMIRTLPELARLTMFSRGVENAQNLNGFYDPVLKNDVLVVFSAGNDAGAHASIVDDPHLARAGEVDDVLARGRDGQVVDHRVAIPKEDDPVLKNDVLVVFSAGNDAGAHASIDAVTPLNDLRLRGYISRGSRFRRAT